MRIVSFPSLVLLLLLVSCGPSDAEREAALETALDSVRVATATALERGMNEAVRRADEIAGAADRILSPLPVMTTADENALRRYLNATHLTRARELGVRVTSEAVRDSLIDAGALVPLADSTRYWVVRPGTDPTWVVPHVPALLETVGERFHARLAEMGLPPYRMEVTIALRTSERQARLRGSNANAASGVSSHEFGTTLDLSYSAFAPPAERPPEVLGSVPPELAPHATRIVDLALESVSGRKSRELGAIFSEVLLGAQGEGLVVVIYERQQTVYHITVARALTSGEG